jgi:hypothetical protein
VPGATLATIRERWLGPIYVKALDGIDWMTRFDRSPLAVDGVTPSRWSWRELGWVPWTVPTAVDPAREGALAGRLAREAGTVILDLEPYAGFWRGTAADADVFLAAYREQTDAPLRISLDHRRLRDGFPYPALMDAAVDFLPQVYWTTFRRPWAAVLAEAEAALAPYRKPIEYVLPGDAAPSDFAAAIEWCTERGTRASAWVWQTIRAENWTVMSDR